MYRANDASVKNPEDAFSTIIELAGIVFPHYFEYLTKRQYHKILTSFSEESGFPHEVVRIVGLFPTN